MTDKRSPKAPGFVSFVKPENRLDQTPAEQAKRGDGRLLYGVGEMLFQQGEAGGDLFFIEEGQVEIFTDNHGETVSLSEMGPGEIIGIMTCMTGETRMASARAKTIVACRRVPHASIRKVVAALPNWMKVVLKEFSLRLGQMNKTYSEAAVRIKRLESSQLSYVYTGAQLAAAFGTLAEFMTFNAPEGRMVVIEDVLQKLELALNIRKDELDRVFNVLLEAGLLKQEIEPDKKRTVTRFENAQKLSYFAQFVRESKHGATKNLVRAKFTHKETRVLSALVKLAARLDMDLDKNGRLGIKELERSLERVTGVKFEREALEKGIALKLLAIQGTGEAEAVVLRPSHLGRTVACVEAVRRLLALDQNPRDQAEADGAAA